MSKKQNSNHGGWNKTTDLGCDVKTILRSDKRMKVGKDYQGVFRLDEEAIVDEYLSRDSHYTFIETIPQTARKRNPRVFEGKYITITRRDDGTFHPNFKPVNIGPGFNIEAYILCVYLEMRMATKGLVEKK